MSDIAEARFVCTACKKQYRWKPELAGKKVKCKCGNVMVAPQQSPGGPEESLYDLAPDLAPAKPVVAAAVVPGPNVTPGAKPRKMAKAKASSAAKASVPTLAYAGLPPTSQRGESRAEFENALGGTPFREIYLPSILALAGIAFHLGSAMYAGGGKWLSIDKALPHFGVNLGVDLVLSAIGILMVAKMFEISFGAIGPAIIKLVAICLVPTAIATIIGSIVGHDSFFVAMMVSSILIFPLCYLFFWLMFDIEFSDAIYCVIVIWLVHSWALMFISSLVFGD